MSAKNKKLISSIFLILIIAPAVLFSRPKQVEAQWIVTDPGLTAITATLVGAPQVIETGNVVVTAIIAIAKQVIMVIEKRLLQEFTKGITGWINTGFHGSPLFLTNSDSFFKDIAKTEIKTIVSEFGYDPNRFPYGQDFALSVINRYKAAADSDAAYSLSAVMSPQLAASYRNNFNTGGWNGFLINTQYPQNNYLGFNFMANDKLARQLQGTTQTAAQKIQTTLNQGMGFLSPQICPNSVNPNYNNGVNEFQKPSFDPSSIPFPSDMVTCDGDALQTEQSKCNQALNNPEGGLPTGCDTIDERIQQCSDEIAAAGDKWKNDTATARTAFDAKNTCTKNGTSALVNTTPGAVAANQIFKALGVNADATALGSMVEGSLSAILNSLVSHFLDQGLNSLGDAINGSSSTTDSWSYQGNTLVTNTSVNAPGTNTNTAFSVSPASVSVFPGNAVNNITISGGTPPYNVLGTCDHGQAGSTPNVIKSACVGGGAWNIADPQFATVYASGAGITVIGVRVGNTSVTIQDSSSPIQTVTLPITITGTDALVIPTSGTPTDNTIGDCLVPGSTIPVSTTKSNCDTVKGSWSPTAAPSNAPMGICTSTGSLAATQNTTQAACISAGNANNVSVTWVPFGSCTVTEPTTLIRTTTLNETLATCDAIGGVFTPNS